MSSPFEEGKFLVLTNNEGQHSLWPSAIDVPSGWTTTYGPSPKEECLDFVNEHWNDMRPKSLMESMSNELQNS